MVVPGLEEALKVMTMIWWLGGGSGGGKADEGSGKKELKVVVIMVFGSHAGCGGHGLDGARQAVRPKSSIPLNT